MEAVTSTPENIVPGSKADVLIKVKNTGSEKAEAVSLRVFKDTSQPFEFSEKSDFIGKLEPNESGEAVIRFTVDTKAPAKKYLIDVELRGIDEKENVMIFRRTVPLSVSMETGGFPLKFVGLIIAILGIAGAAYYMRRKKILQP